MNEPDLDEFWRIIVRNYEQEMRDQVALYDKYESLDREWYNSLTRIGRHRISEADAHHLYRLQENWAAVKERVKEFIRPADVFRLEDLVDQMHEFVRVVMA